MSRRLDVFLKEEYGLSRNTAKEVIKSGDVFVDRKKIAKPSFIVDAENEVKVNAEGLPRYVSRGGAKLERALDFFNIDLNGKSCLDIGASTGGFTDCMLKHGAGLVIAVDVGTKQLDKRLLEDKRVVSMENTNVADINPETIHKSEFCAIDVSFVSLTKIFVFIKPLLKEGASIVALVKPQFEAGKGNVCKGIVKDRLLHRKVLNEVIHYLSDTGFNVKGIIPSPIKGTAGNIEYLLYMDMNLLGGFNKEIYNMIPIVEEEAFKM